MSNRGGRSGGGRRGGGGPGRNPNNRTQNNKPQNSPKPQQPKLSENEPIPNEPTASPEVKSSPAPQPETSSPSTKTSTPGGGKNPPPKNQQQQKKVPPAKGGAKQPPAKGTTPQQPKSPQTPAEKPDSTTTQDVESPKVDTAAKKPTQPVGKKEPAPKTTTPAQTKQPQQNTKPQGGQQQGGKKSTQQPAAKVNQPAKKDAAPPVKKDAKKPSSLVDDDSDDKDPTISAATSGVFQFGQPVHGFTPMSFNFSLPAANDVPPVEAELPSHSGPCVVTTGGQTYELEQKATVTLEENEDVVFVSRAKLYRYDPETQEWKERGVGDYKVLKHKETGKFRILMRRDKIHKVCANHNVPPVELKPHPSFPETCWVYQTDSDFSEELVKKSTFAVRFQNIETAQQFEKIYNNARSSLGFEVEVVKVVPSKEAVHEQIIEMKSDLGLAASPAPEELTLDFLYKEILEMKSTIKTMQQDILHIKSIMK